jgi:hypothetical protein
MIMESKINTTFVIARIVLRWLHPATGLWLAANLVLDRAILGLKRDGLRLNWLTGDRPKQVLDSIFLVRRIIPIC